MFTTKMIVAPSATESPYGHVHHATILRFLEKNRSELLEAIGHPTEEYIKNNLFLVISALQVSYLREVVSGEICLSCYDGKIEGKKIILHQNLLNQRGKLSVTAKVESVFMDGASRRAVAPPADFVTALLTRLA